MRLLGEASRGERRSLGECDGSIEREMRKAIERGKLDEEEMRWGLECISTMDDLWEVVTAGHLEKKSGWAASTSTMKTAP